jgi:hypothetical protein
VVDLIAPYYSEGRTAARPLRWRPAARALHAAMVLPVGASGGGGFFRHAVVLGMKAQIGVDADSGLVPTVGGLGQCRRRHRRQQPAAQPGSRCLRGRWLPGDRQGRRCQGQRHLAHRHEVGQASHAEQGKGPPVLTNQLEELEAGICAKVEHPFRVIKRQRLRQAALPGIEEEHGPTGRAVCAVQLVDGAHQVAGNAGMSSPSNGRKNGANVIGARQCTDGFVGFAAFRFHGSA